VIAIRKEGANRFLTPLAAKEWLD